MLMFYYFNVHKFKYTYYTNLMKIREIIKKISISKTICNRLISLYNFFIYQLSQLGIRNYV